MSFRARERHIVSKSVVYTFYEVFKCVLLHTLLRVKKVSLVSGCVFSDGWLVLRSGLAFSGCAPLEVGLSCASLGKKISPILDALAVVRALRQAAEEYTAEQFEAAQRSAQAVSARVDQLEALTHKALRRAPLVRTLKSSK